MLIAEVFTYHAVFGRSDAGPWLPLDVRHLLQQSMVPKAQNTKQTTTKNKNDSGEKRG